MNTDMFLYGFGPIGLFIAYAAVRSIWDWLDK